MRYSWILLDADGTLFDFEAAQAAALERTWREASLGREPRLLELFRRANAEQWRLYERGEVTQERLRVQRFRGLLHDLVLAADAEALSAAFVRHLSEEGRLMAGAAELLGELADRASLALVTNGIAEVQRGRLARSGVAHHFSAVVISGEVGAAKPDGRFFDAAFEAAGSPPREEVVIVGDSLSSDIRGGLDYGIDTCWYAANGEPDDPEIAPRFTVRDYGELRRALGVDRG